MELQVAFNNHNINCVEQYQQVTSLYMDKNSLSQEYDCFNSVAIDNQNNVEHQLQLSSDEQCQEEYCYFCKQVNMNSCVNRSLYHKYNDVGDKYIRDIDHILQKQKSLARYLYDEIQYDIDDIDNFKSQYQNTKSSIEMVELLEYYKYRRFVPIFSKAKNAISTTESIYYYYYQRLKIYYNNIKKQLDMTIENTSKSEDQSSMVSASDKSSKKDMSNLLEDAQLEGLEKFLSEQSVKFCQSQSKALQDVMRLLRKNEDQLKKIKTLKTEDCIFLNQYQDQPKPLYQVARKNPGSKNKINDPFQDYKQHYQHACFNKTNDKPMISTSDNNSHLKLGNVTKISKKLQKNNEKNIFFRYIQSLKTVKGNDAKMQVKSKKKSFDSVKNIQKKKQQHQGYQVKEKAIPDSYPYYNIIEKQMQTDNIPEYGDSQLKKHRNQNQVLNSNRSRKSIDKNARSSNKDKPLRKLSELREQNLLLTERNNQVRQEVKSLPKVLMEFQIKSRSLSSLSMKYPQNLNNHPANRLSSHILPFNHKIEPSPYDKLARKQISESITKNRSNKKIIRNRSKDKQISNENKDFYRYRLNRQTSTHKLKGKQGLKKIQKKTYNPSNIYDPMEEQANYHSLTNTHTLKTNIEKKQTHKNTVEIEDGDNLASVRRKKIDQLKLKSNKKKNVKL